MRVFTANNSSYIVSSVFSQPALQVFFGQRRQSINPGRVVVEAGNIVELCAAGSMKLLAPGDGDFFHGFEAVGRKAGAENV